MADEFWERAAQQDPLWAILSDPVMRGRRWNLSDFFESGAREIALLDYQLRRLGRSPKPARALDFGCGVGRLTQALAARFDHVVGIDVSPTMIELARRLNRYPEKVHYVLNQAPDLSQIESASIDFLYSDIVLQHLEPERTRVYVAEFMRLLPLGGIAVFQLPSVRRPPSEISNRPLSMPMDAYRASIQIVGALPAFLGPQEAVTLTVDVTNTSSIAWDQSAVGAIRLGNHWRGASGEMLIQDDGRAALKGVIEAREMLRASIKVQAPPDAATFLCELDLVHEGISWFADRGSRVVSARVTVAGAETAPQSSPPPAGDRGEDFPDIYEGLPTGEGDGIEAFPMFGIPQGDVLSLVDAQGGEAFLIEPDERGGPEWEGYRYYIVRTS